MANREERDKVDRTPSKRFFTPRKKVCRFCERNIRDIDYKAVDILRKYIPDRGKIAPRRVTGTCAYHQRKLARAIKRARIMALLPFVED
ncbi:MAG: 30S ribosomal protein S18 [Acidobacteriota bacterium]|nr:30S ribosomal protein S18 [Acidobacteriota bacterium]MDW3228385.1 30S ribosomal protein S18 [Acidobacteriota bacterium]